MENIFKFPVDAGINQPYVSIGHEENGNFSITVRGPHPELFPSIPGPIGYIEMTCDQFIELVRGCERATTIRRTLRS